VRGGEGGLPKIHGISGTKGEGAQQRGVWPERGMQHTGRSSHGVISARSAAWMMAKKGQVHSKTNRWHMQRDLPHYWGLCREHHNLPYYQADIPWRTPTWCPVSVRESWLVGTVGTVGTSEACWQLSLFCAMAGCVSTDQRCTDWSSKQRGRKNTINVAMLILRQCKRVTDGWGSVQK